MPAYSIRLDIANAAPAKLALSPFPTLRPVVSCVRVHQHIIPDDMGIPSLAPLALSGLGYADFHVGVNFALTQFYEVG